MVGRSGLVWLAAGICCAALASAVGSDRVSADAVVHKVGQITWHAKKFVDQDVTLVGYVLARDKDYVFFSDEPKGKVSAHDLAVAGPGLDQTEPMKKYVIEGRFLDHGLKARNGSVYHLELTAPPREAKP